MSGRSKQTDRLYMRVSPVLMDLLLREAKQLYGEKGSVSDVVRKALFEHYVQIFNYVPGSSAWCALRSDIFGGQRLDQDAL